MLKSLIFNVLMCWIQNFQDKPFTLNFLSSVVIVNISLFYKCNLDIFYFFGNKQFRYHLHRHCYLPPILFI